MYSTFPTHKLKQEERRLTDDIRDLWKNRHAPGTSFRHTRYVMQNLLVSLYEIRHVLKFR